MSCHYWAPTDYLSPDNLKIPSELAYKASPADPIDLLFFKINSSYPGNYMLQEGGITIPLNTNMRISPGYSIGYNTIPHWMPSSTFSFRDNLILVITLKISPRLSKSITLQEIGSIITYGSETGIREHSATSSNSAMRRRIFASTPSPIQNPNQSMELNSRRLTGYRPNSEWIKIFQPVWCRATIGNCLTINTLTLCSTQR